ncbi:MAG: hypothetical protein Ct9H300mP18_11330 [Candidatus Neomarinimicrobiota bacterium]|nr:MAG: hypothetical protein Ct9H300mP18_11330 [Candidatus Neomarinimicrobiota bacterium]
MINQKINHDLSYNSSDYIHVLTEIERRAYAGRSEHLGDSDYWDVPLGKSFYQNLTQKSDRWY